MSAFKNEITHISAAINAINVENEQQQQEMMEDVVHDYQSSPAISANIPTKANEAAISSLGSGPLFSPLVSGSAASRHATPETKAIAAYQILVQNTNQRQAEFAQAVVENVDPSVRSQLLEGLTAAQQEMEAYRKVCQSLFPGVNAFKSEQEMTRREEAEKRNARSFVPPDFPALQFNGSKKWDSSKKAHESAQAFLRAFADKLEAHDMPLEEHWERLLTLCLSDQDRLWLKSKIVKKGYSWEKCCQLVTDKFDAPYRRYWLHTELMRMQQKPKESVSSYIEKYQQKVLEAGCEQNQVLVLHFLSSLRPEVRAKAFFLVASAYGKEMPGDLELVCQAILAGTSDNKRTYDDDEESDEERRVRSHTYRHDHRGRKQEKARHHSTKKNNLCTWCNEPWVHRHQCREYFEKDNKPVPLRFRRDHDSKQSRKDFLARSACRTNLGKGTGNVKHDTSEDEVDQPMEDLELTSQGKNAGLYRASSTHQKSSDKTKSHFVPLTIQNERLTALVDSGADFSAIDYNLCKKLG